MCRIGQHPPSGRAVLPSPLSNMKNPFLIPTASFLYTTSAFSHGIDGHLYRGENEGDVSREQQSSLRSKTLTGPVVEQEVRWWGISLSTGWTSHEMHYGIDEMATTALTRRT
jgi:hypothetical protein